MTISSPSSNLMTIGAQAANSGRKKTYNEIMADRRTEKSSDMDHFNQKLDDQIKIMCALLKGQMPDKESDPEKMMQPIFQIMSTEQLVMMNRNMVKMSQTQERNSQLEVTSLLGQDVEVKTKDFTFKDEPLDFSYTLPEYINNPKCEIYSVHNPKNPVHSIDLDPSQLSGQLKWTGHLPTGEMAKEGAYRIRVVGESKTDKPNEGESKVIEAETTLFTHVDAVHLAKGKEGAQLVSGKMVFSSSDIQSVRRAERLQKNYISHDQSTQSTQINENV
jgi:flagellar hook assembly protein FlgD